MSNTKASLQASRLLLFAPAAIWVLLFYAIPYALMGYISLKPSSTMGVYGEGFTLDNYIFNLTDPVYWEIILETLFQAVLNIVVTLFLAYPVAYHLARGVKKHQGLFFTLVLSPLLVGVIIRCYGWMIILADRGLINDALMSMGVINGPLPLMYSRFGVLVGLVQVYLPYMIMSLTGAIQAVNPELDYTARSLGASRFTAFRMITLPMSMPGILSGTVLVFVLSVSSYAIPLLLGGFKVVTAPLFIVQNAIEASDWPGGSAMAIIMFVVVLILLTVYIRALSRTMRGLK